MESYLDFDNIQRSREDVEWHPLRPFLPDNARVLFLGSFPPPRRRWCMDFYYPNFTNDHWRIEGLAFYGDRNHFVDEANKTFRLSLITDFLRERGIALFDTATAIRRLASNASDKYLEVVQPTDIRSLVGRLPQLRSIATTGEKACSTICRHLQIATPPKVGASVVVPPLREGDAERLLFRLPSSSRAYPLSLEKKAAAYERMFRQTGLL